MPAWNLGESPLAPSVPHSVNLSRWRPPLVEAGAPFARFSLYMQVVKALPKMPGPMPAKIMLRWLASESAKLRITLRLGRLTSRNILAAGECVRFEYADGLWREKPEEAEKESESCSTSSPG